jgi:mannan endo-1,4-beta-mannosidase
MSLLKMIGALPVLLALSTNAFCGAMQGAYVNKDGWVPSYISQFNTDVAKPLAIVNLFTSFDYNWANQLRYQSSNIVSLQATPMITWMPITSGRKTINLLPEILSGQWDTYINNWINGLKTWQATYPINARPTLLIRFAHEFNGNWYPWGNDPTNLKAAWRYMKTKFNAAGVTNVEWVWCANNVNVDSYNNVNLYYPGDDVVDWTGLDGYNWGSNYSFSRWKSFNETFSIPYINLVTAFPNKPVMLGEVASAEPSDTPNLAYGQNGNNADANENKDVWVQDMYARIMSEYPAIRAIAWFNLNKELSWALNGTAKNGLANTGLNAYRSAMSNPFYLGSFTPLYSLIASLETPDDPTHGEFNFFTISSPNVFRGDISLGLINSYAYDPDFYYQASFAANDNRALPKRGLYHILPIAEGHSLRASEEEGFRRLSPQAKAAILNSKLELITTDPSE